MKRFLKSKILIDTGALLEYFKLILYSRSNKLNKNKQLEFTLFNELFKERDIFIIPQVLAELYSLMKRDTKKSLAEIKHWLELLEDPFLKLLNEIYITKEEILKEKKYLDFGFTDIALMQALDKSNFLLTTDTKLVFLCRNKGYEAHHIKEILDF
ncbi:MAG: hypothetical protein ACTSRI_12115 [Promethearchaeota archaeon]